MLHAHGRSESPRNGWLPWLANRPTAIRLSRSQRRECAMRCERAAACCAAAHAVCASAAFDCDSDRTTVTAWPFNFSLCIRPAADPRIPLRPSVTSHSHPPTSLSSALSPPPALPCMPSSVAMDHPPPLGRRSSFQAHQDAMAADHSGHQHDAANSSSMRESNEPIIKSTDMPEQMQQHAVQAALKAQAQAKEEGADSHAHTHGRAEPTSDRDHEHHGRQSARSQCDDPLEGSHAQSGGRRAPPSA